MSLQKHAAEVNLHCIALFEMPDAEAGLVQPVSNNAHKTTVAKLVTDRHPADMDDVTFLDDCFESESAPPFSTDEKLELHRALLERSCEELREAIETENHSLMDDVRSWFQDTSWRPYSFRVCAAIEGVDPEIFLTQMAIQMKKSERPVPIAPLEGFLCTPITSCSATRNV